MNEALKSLGLQPHATQLQGGSAREDRLRQLDAGRFEPPARYADQFEAYSRGIAEGNRDE
jgi:hypothetical protein